MSPNSCVHTTTSVHIPYITHAIPPERHIITHNRYKYTITPQAHTPHFPHTYNKISHTTDTHPQTYTAHIVHIRHKYTCKAYVSHLYTHTIYIAQHTHILSSIYMLHNTTYTKHSTDIPQNTSENTQHRQQYPHDMHNTVLHSTYTTFIHMDPDICTTLVYHKHANTKTKNHSYNHDHMIYMPRIVHMDHT